MRGTTQAIVAPGPVADLPFGHTADKLIPRGLIGSAVLHTRLGGVVQKLIIADPEGGIPGFVVGPTVVGVLHWVGVVWFF